MYSRAATTAFHREKLKGGLKDMSICIISLLALYVVLLSATSAYAYLDPGSGSMILQLILGGLAGLVVILKLYWHRVLALFGIRKVEEEDAKREHS